MSSQSFADLGASRPVVDTLSARGITSPFPVQRLVIPDVLAGRDVLAKSPTGSGKTLAFGIPMVDRIEATDPRPSALILAPTRELASQIVDELYGRSPTPGRCRSRPSTAAPASSARAAPPARRTSSSPRPGRLEDLIARGAVSLAKVKILVLDEADRMLDMGFRPPVDRIVRRDTPRRRQTLFFSATLDGEVGRIAHAYTTDARTHEHRAPAEQRADVEHRFVPVAHDGKLDALVRELRHEERGLTLVFVRTKRGADRLVKRLRSHGVTALAMHGNKTQGQREKALARFGVGRGRHARRDRRRRARPRRRGHHARHQLRRPRRPRGLHPPRGPHRPRRRTGVGITFVPADQTKDVRRIASDLSLHAEFDQAGLGTPSRPAGARRRRRR